MSFLSIYHPGSVIGHVGIVEIMALISSLLHRRITSNNHTSRHVMANFISARREYARRPNLNERIKTGWELNGEKMGVKRVPGLGSPGEVTLGQNRTWQGWGTDVDSCDWCLLRKQGRMCTLLGWQAGRAQSGGDLENIGGVWFFFMKNHLYSFKPERICSD